MFEESSEEDSDEDIQDMEPAEFEEDNSDEEIEEGEFKDEEDPTVKAIIHFKQAQKDLSPPIKESHFFLTFCQMNHKIFSSNMI